MGEKKINIGAIVYDEGNSVQNKTGSWRTFKPELDKDKCIRCFECYVFCPEPCIDLNEENYPVIDYDYCKGCGICAEQCPVDAIEMVKEEK